MLKQDWSLDVSSLQEFLRLPEVKPAFEHIGGKMIQKMSPNRPHGLLQMTLGSHLLDHVCSKKLGMIYSELRCSFRRDSHVPDLCSIARGRLPRDDRGVLASKIRMAPDLAIEILLPGQTVGEVMKKLRLAIAHGLRLGWLIDPIKRQVYVARPRRKVEILRAGAVLSGEDVMPGDSLGLDELFSRMDED